MAPTVYLHLHSPPCRTVTMTADLLGLKLNVVELNPIARTQDTPEMTMKNPMRTIPSLVDKDGFSIGDSHAIIIYIFEKYSKPEHEYLYPKDLKIRTLVLQRLFVDCGIFFRTLRSIMAPIYGGILTELKRGHIRNIEDAYRIANDYLSNTKFLAADHLTLADVSAVTTIASLHLLHPIDATRFSNTKHWLDTMAEFDFYKYNNAEWCILHIEVLKHFMSKNKKRQSKL